MTQRWHRTRDLVGLPGMPKVARPIRLHGVKRGWTCRDAKWGSRAVLEWLESSLPPETQAALRAARGEAAPQNLPAEPAGSGSRASADAEVPLPAILPDDGPGAIADARAEIVATFERWRKGQRRKMIPALREWAALYAVSGAGVSDETRAAVPSFAWNTLRRWRWTYLDRGAAGLLPGCGGRRSGIDADTEIRDAAEAQIRTRWPHITARQIQRVIRADFPDRAPPSISQLHRWTRKFVATHRFELSAVGDPDGHRAKFMPAFGRAAEDVMALNQLWELDSTTADVMCADGKRHALVAAIDVWSRRVRVLVVPTSKAAAIAALIRRCLLAWGAPEQIKTDEGADYTSRHLRRVIAELGVTHIVCPPYSPDKKPFIERFIGTISRDLLSQLPGFTGHNVAEAEKLRSRKSFSQRRGQEPVAQFRCTLTPEELQQRIDAWCEAIYEREDHAGLGGETPLARAASWAGERRRVDERGLDVLLAAPAGDGSRVVNTDGIHVDGGLYIAAELGLFMRQRVQVRQDPGDYGRIFVFDADGRFVCVAEDPLRTGIDREEVARQARALANGENRAARKRTRDLAKAHRTDTAMDRVLAHATEAAEQVVAFPAPAEVHRTARMAAAAEAEDAADALEVPAERRSTGTGDTDIELFKRFHKEGFYDR